MLLLCKLITLVHVTYYLNSGSSFFPLKTSERTLLLLGKCQCSPRYHWVPIFAQPLKEQVYVVCWLILIFFIICLKEALYQVLYLLISVFFVHLPFHKTTLSPGWKSWFTKFEWFVTHKKKKLILAIISLT